MTRSVMVPLVNYGGLAFIEQCCSVLMPLVYATSIPYGGLGLSTFAIGIIMTTLGIIIGFSSAFGFPILLRKMGIYRLYRTALQGYLVIVASFPIMNLLAKRAGCVDGYVLAVLAVQLFCVIATVMTFSESIFNYAFPPHQLTLCSKAACSSISVTLHLLNLPSGPSTDWHKQLLVQSVYLHR